MNDNEKLVLWLSRTFCRQETRDKTSKDVILIIEHNRILLGYK